MSGRKATFDKQGGEGGEKIEEHAIKMSERRESVAQSRTRKEKTLRTISDHIEISFLCVEFNGEASNISHGIGTPSRA
jgi:hypothetical protein